MYIYILIPNIIQFIYNLSFKEEETVTTRLLYYNFHLLAKDFLSGVSTINFVSC